MLASVLNVCSCLILKQALVCWRVTALWSCTGNGSGGRGQNSCPLAVRPTALREVHARTVRLPRLTSMLSLMDDQKQQGGRVTDLIITLKLPVHLSSDSDLQGPEGWNNLRAAVQLPIIISTGCSYYGQDL